MAVGDIHITLGNLAAGASVQVQTLTRAKVIVGANTPNSLIHVALSEDNATYYTFLAAGWILQGHTGATSVGNQSWYIAANYYVQLTNTDTAAHDYIVEFIEY